MSLLESIWLKNLEQGTMQLPRCQQCQGWNWYPLPACKHCQSLDLEWQAVKPEGRVYSWTRVHRNFSGHTMPCIPYIVGIIEIADAPEVRIPCYFMNSEDSEPTINSLVQLLPCRVDDRLFWGFQV